MELLQQVVPTYQARCAKYEVTMHFELKAFGVFWKKKAWTRASFLVSNHIAKAKKPFTIGEELVLPATKDIFCDILAEAAVKKIAQVPLSASTISLCIWEIAEDIETQLLERINASL